MEFSKFKSIILMKIIYIIMVNNMPFIEYFLIPFIYFINIFELMKYIIILKERYNLYFFGIKNHKNFITTKLISFNLSV